MAFQEVQPVMVARHVFGFLLIVAGEALVVALAGALVLVDAKALTDAWNDQFHQYSSYPPPFAEDHPRQAGLVMLGLYTALGMVLGVGFGFVAWLQRRRGLRSVRPISRIPGVELTQRPPKSFTRKAILSAAGILFVGLAGGIGGADVPGFVFIAGLVAGCLLGICLVLLHSNWRLGLWQRHRDQVLVELPSGYRTPDNPGGRSPFRPQWYSVPVKQLSRAP